MAAFDSVDVTRQLTYTPTTKTLAIDPNGLVRPVSSGTHAPSS
jgi:hypothetical protein